LGSVEDFLEDQDEDDDESGKGGGSGTIDMCQRLAIAASIVLSCVFVGFECVHRRPSNLTIKLVHMVQHCESSR
jgi:hypothetical protein